jgi:hydrogenase maturation protease
MNANVERTLVVGCGDRFAHDDAAGLIVVDELRKRSDLECELRTVEAGVPSTIVEEVTRAKLLVVLDSVESSGPAGTFHCVRLPSASVKPRHPLFPAGTIQSSSAGPKTFLIGIAAADCTPGPGLSPKVQIAVDQLVQDFPRYLKLAQELTADPPIHEKG